MANGKRVVTVRLSFELHAAWVEHCERWDKSLEGGIRHVMRAEMSRVAQQVVSDRDAILQRVLSGA